ncbi:Fic family protein [Deinococcus sp.]|uniref:Fic family protein n=1 Tax=Deinococcus sp. TaxID=47478 RepID=UPI003B59E5FB
MGNLGSDGKPFSQPETERLERALVSLYRQLPEVAPDALNIKLLQTWHHQLADGMERMQAGQLRSADITFGSYFDTAPNQIEIELSVMIFKHLEHLPLLSEATETLEHATWLHAEIIRIHPFWDGNGRLARAVQTWLCWRSGQRAPQYPVRTAYLGGLNRYHNTRNLDLLMDVTLSSLRTQSQQF